MNNVKCSISMTHNFNKRSADKIDVELILSVAKDLNGE